MSNDTSKKIPAIFLNPDKLIIRTRKVEDDHPSTESYVFTHSPRTPKIAKLSYRCGGGMYRYGQQLEIEIIDKEQLVEACKYPGKSRDFPTWNSNQDLVAVLCNPGERITSISGRGLRVLPYYFAITALASLALRKSGVNDERVLLETLLARLDGLLKAIESDTEKVRELL